MGDADLKNANRLERDELAAPTAEFELLQEANGQAATGSESVNSGKSSQRKSKRKG